MDNQLCSFVSPEQPLYFYNHLNISGATWHNSKLPAPHASTYY